jgi:bifunctional UDP-N-acetylglucosamine pyrophosphorylase/glucosamine-1-phosphate N-acetyltransferase
MAASDLHVVVLAGGDSTRIRTGGPKALLDLCGRPLLEHVFLAARGTSAASPLAQAASRTLVLGPKHREAVAGWLAKSDHRNFQVVVQEKARGTGDAVLCALEVLPTSGRLLILMGDTPLLGAEVLEELAGNRNALLTAIVPDPTGYGRILRSEEGEMLGIIEEKDADEEQRAIEEVNAGVYVLEIGPLRTALAQTGTANAQRELYLTDAAYAVLSEREGSTVCLSDDPDQIFGVNDLFDFARACAAMREGIMSAHMQAGVIVEDPATTFIECGVEIAPGARLLPFTVIRHDVKIGPRCVVGPFSHLRPGTVLEEGAEIGNFVETKNAQFGAGAKAKHLSYLGDAVIGARANIGCGTITANWDGKVKHRTVVGERAFVGSGTVLVAPVRVGNGATTAAGAVVLHGRDVPDGATVAGVPARPLKTSKPSSPTHPPSSPNQP